ncbi:MAG TPA: Mrp/NBP35 family ATP-binding protein [Candidatus Binatia bacterium]|nr:Mrp/NBP35 family ATP-binding protein [Candidatus Binatia bacterium]
MISEQDIRDQLKRITYPGSRRDIVTLGLVGEILTKDGTVVVHLRPSSATEEVLRHLTGRITSALSAVPGVQRVTIHGGHPRGATAQSPPVAAPALTPLPGVRRVIAVASGKGGVGKSTVAVNLALALKALGNRVGLLDADIYGPSVPLMMGTEATPRAGQNKKIYPVEKYGISLISMGFFLDDKSPVIWRGPIVMSIVRQFLRDVLWGELDYLVVDLPPGTGDAALTLAQEVPLSGGVIVSTPQDVALLDVQRGIAMFRQVNVPILGVIENMSYYECPHCGEREEIFSHGGVRKTGLEVLGEVPIVEEVCTGGDVGKPLVVQYPEHPVSQVFRQIATRIMETDATTLRQGQRQ